MEETQIYVLERQLPHWGQTWERVPNRFQMNHRFLEKKNWGKPGKISVPVKPGMQPKTWLKVSRATKGFFLGYWDQSNFQGNTLACLSFSLVKSAVGTWVLGKPMACIRRVALVFFMPHYCREGSWLVSGEYPAPSPSRGNSSGTLV